MKNETRYVVRLDHTGELSRYPVNTLNTYAQIKDLLDDVTLTSTMLLFERNGVRLRYDVICDDEALLKDPVPYPVIFMDGNPWLHGPLLITQHDKMGENIGITENDIAFIKRNLTPVCVSNHFATWWAWNYEVPSAFRHPHHLL